MSQRVKLRHSLLLLPVLALPLLHCGDDDPPVPSQPVGDGGADGAPSSPAEEPDKPLVPATKVDLLFAIDNSQSMGDKQQLLGSAVSRIIRKLTDEAHVADIHVGVISSSLGSMGGDVCVDKDTSGNVVRPRVDDHGHLLDKGSDGKTVVAGAEQGFLAFGPGGITDVAQLEKGATDLILGVGQGGCGHEAQLESVYRFLNQPDPPLSITLDGTKANYVGVDEELLKQRKAFLRPDSAVAIVMLTDEDDSQIDPRANGGTGWKFSVIDYPGSKVPRAYTPDSHTAPRGTVTCDSAAASADCISCEQCNSDPACKAKQDPNCSKSGVDGQSGAGYDGFHAPDDDDLNIRMQRMKQRYGVDPQFPVDRYVRGLTNRKVPNRDTEHDAVTGKYVHADTCTNPLFAASLPATAGEEICHLPEGNRSRRLVLFQLIGGVPPGLVAAAPDWTKILGQDPDTYDLTGIDPHMIQSSTPRAGLSGGGDAQSPRGMNGTDPVNGREWDTQNRDLQYACTFALPQERPCVANSQSCDCFDDPSEPNKPLGNPPLCKTDGTAVQVRAKAYPTIRELRVVKGLEERGVASSICAADPTAGYGPLLDAMASKLTGVLAK